MGDAAQTYAVTQIAAAAAAGIHTFVVGVDTTKASSVARLDQLALAGLEPRSATNPLEPRFYLVSTVDALTEALKVIAHAAACR